MKKAFSMIELIVVIIVMGILSSIVLSKMSVSRDDAFITGAKSQVQVIRSAITIIRSKNLMRGMVADVNPKKLDALPSDTSTYKNGEKLFDYDTVSGDESKSLFDYPIQAGDANGQWKKLPKTADGKYPYEIKLLNVGLQFLYDPSDGSFDCNHNAADQTLKMLCDTINE